MKAEKNQKLLTGNPGALYLHRDANVHMRREMKKEEKNSNCCSGLSEFLSAKAFKALSDPNRLTILEWLASGGKPKTVSEVATCCPVNISVVSRHLGCLREVGILEANKKGKEVFYRVRVKEFATWLRELADALEQCCPEGECDIRGK